MMVTERRYKTVLTILGSYPIPVFGIGGLMGFLPFLIRPTQEGERLWVDCVALSHCGRFCKRCRTVQPLDREQKVSTGLSADELECTKLVQSICSKGGVSFAVFEEKIVKSTVLWSMSVYPCVQHRN